MRTPSVVTNEIVIEPDSELKNYWRDIWRYRELFYILAWRDVAVRYKQTVLGIVWAVIRPFVTMIVFTVVFNQVAKLEAPGSVPYPLLVFAAMLPWQFFSTALSESSGSLVSNANLISKVYFPRLIVPAGSVITSFVDFLITLLMMGVLMVWYGFFPDWRIVTLPLFVALAFGCAFGAGLWLCALNVKYRDFRYVIPFIVQFGLYVSPVGFSSDKIPEQWRLLYACNPMVGVIDGFRWSLLRGETPLDGSAVVASVLVTLMFSLTGFCYFRKMEDGFADVI
jgi:lipopolysaccharide transport system permease protein